MPDRYQQLINSPVGERIADLVGLPKPHDLRRYEAGQPLVDGGPVLLLRLPAGRLTTPARQLLQATGTETVDRPADDETKMRYGAIVVDASGIGASDDLHFLYEALHTTLTGLAHCGRVVVLGGIPASESTPKARAAQRSLEGFVRSVAKELRAGSTANLIEVAPGSEDGLAGPLCFILSAKSAFVCGQRLSVGPASRLRPDAPSDSSRPLAGKVAVVTGAARGIGASIAEVMARDGARVVCLDLPSAGEQLSETANQVGGAALQLDITAEDTPARLAEFLRDRFDGVDIVVHNAGITRDKTLFGMDEARWNLVMAVNLTSIERVNAHLLDEKTKVLREGSRIICVSSMSGIAGNRGQTNYSTSKAGVIGHVEALAEAMAERGGTINAVAPGFIETEMTDAMPFGVREVGRRISSLGQGGLPEDVAETIAFFSWSESAWVNGTTLRVCGQNLLGA